MTTGISSSSVGFFDLLTGSDPRNPDQPLVPLDMVLSSASLRTMFFHFDMSKVFVVASSRRNSSFDGLPVFARIYMLDMRFMPPASRWTPIFNGNDQTAVQIQSCVAVFDRSSFPDAGIHNMYICLIMLLDYDHVIGLSCYCIMFDHVIGAGSQLAVCAMTNTSGFLGLLQMDLVTYAASFPSTCYAGFSGFRIPTTRLRFETELITVPQKLLFSGDSATQQTLPSLLVGAPLMDDLYATILYIGASSSSSVRQLPFPTFAVGGIGSFKSMAFTGDGTALFAVDEQPGIWRWKVLPGEVFEFVRVQRYVHPMANAVWKIMVWPNSRLVVATDYSINLWTQCSPCPVGTVTYASNSTEGILDRCICPSGTYNNLRDFRSTCTNCTRPGQVCPGSTYRTMKAQDMLCTVVPVKTDEGCARCVLYPSKGIGYFLRFDNICLLFDHVLGAGARRRLTVLPRRS